MLIADARALASRVVDGRSAGASAVAAVAAALRCFPLARACRLADLEQLAVLHGALLRAVAATPYRTDEAWSPPEYARALVDDEDIDDTLAVPATYAVDAAFAALFAAEGKHHRGFTPDPTDPRFWPRKALTEALLAADAVNRLVFRDDALDLELRAQEADAIALDAGVPVADVLDGALAAGAALADRLRAHEE